MSGHPESKRPAAGADAHNPIGVAASPLPPGLWLVATPIGNAADITLRALDVLRQADVLACEDTRRTRGLLSLHGIATAGRPVLSYNDRNGPARRPQLLAMLGEGKSVAYVCDAGTPLIADPGYRLVEAARGAGHAVHAAPGPSAVLAALSVAGLPTDRFFFAGFLPTKTAARRRELARLKDIPATLIFFESPRRLAASLSDMVGAFGEDRDASVARELTKLFEEVRRGQLGALADAFRAGDTPKGEIVVVVGPPQGKRASADQAPDLDAVLRTALKTMSVKDAARSVAEQLGLPRRDVYARAVELTN